MIMNCEVIPAPKIDYETHIRELREVGNKFNEILLTARTKGFINPKEVQSACDELQIIEDKMKEEIPMAYWQSKGLNKGGKKTQPDPYKWCKTTVQKILAQQEYCGDVINFKTYSKNFKNKKRLQNPEENWKIF